MAINISKEFEPQPVNEQQKKLLSCLREEFSFVYNLINSKCPEGRYKALALTQLEGAAMWATKSITHEWDIADD